MSFSLALIQGLQNCTVSVVKRTYAPPCRPATAVSSLAHSANRACSVQPGFDDVTALRRHLYAKMGLRQSSMEGDYVGSYHHRAGSGQECFPGSWRGRIGPRSVPQEVEAGPGAGVASVNVV